MFFWDYVHLPLGLNIELWEELHKIMKERQIIQWVYIKPNNLLHIYIIQYYLQEYI